VLFFTFLVIAVIGGMSGSWLRELREPRNKEDK